MLRVILLLDWTIGETGIHIFRNMSTGLLLISAGESGVDHSRQWATRQDIQQLGPVRGSWASNNHLCETVCYFWLIIFHPRIFRFQLWSKKMEREIKCIEWSWWCWEQQLNFGTLHRLRYTIHHEFRRSLWGCDIFVVRITDASPGKLINWKANWLLAQSRTPVIYIDGVPRFLSHQRKTVISVRNKVNLRSSICHDQGSKQVNILNKPLFELLIVPQL